MSKKILNFLLWAKTVFLLLLCCSTIISASENNQLVDWGPQYRYPRRIKTQKQQDEWRKAARKYALPKEIKEQISKKDFKTKDDFLADDSPYLMRTESTSITSLPEIIAMKFFMYDKGEEIDRLCNAEQMRILIKNHGLDNTFVIPQKWFHYARGMWRVLSGYIKLMPLKKVNTAQIKDMIKLAELSGYMDWIENIYPTLGGKLAIVDTEDLSFCCNKNHINAFYLQQFCCGLNDYPWNCRAMLALNTLLFKYIKRSAREEAEAYVKTLFTQPDACKEIIVLPWQKRQDAGIDWSILRTSQYSGWGTVSDVEEEMQILLNAENNKELH
jgi:hypothetical protein